MRKAGRSWEIVFDGGSLPSVQTAIKADLGLSILSPLSVVPGIKLVGKNRGLPSLPQVDLAFYSRKSGSPPIVEKIADFILNAVARWENNATDAAPGLALPQMTLPVR